MHYNNLYKYSMLISSNMLEKEQIQQTIIALLENLDAKLSLEILTHLQKKFTNKAASLEHIEAYYLCIKRVASVRVNVVGLNPENTDSNDLSVKEVIRPYFDTKNEILDYLRHSQTIYLRTSQKILLQTINELFRVNLLTYSKQLKIHNRTWKNKVIVPQVLEVHYTQGLSETFGFINPKTKEGNNGLLNLLKSYLYANKPSVLSPSDWKYLDEQLRKMDIPTLRQEAQNLMLKLNLNQNILAVYEPSRSIAELTEEEKNFLNAFSSVNLKDIKKKIETDLKKEGFNHEKRNKTG